MVDLFAITNRGLEGISSDEMGRVPGLRVSQISYRCISATHTEELRGLLDLRTVDDIFVDLATWDGIVPQRSALDHVTRLAENLKLYPALETIAQIRPIRTSPTFSVTANFVGKRNYSADEIKAALATGISARYGWLYADDNKSDINIRIFLEHERAKVGLRLAATPLHRRPYKQSHLPGSLKPTIAAAMLYIAEVLPGESVLDPFCGAGTILIEAALSGVEAFGGDKDSQALAAARKNAAMASVAIAVQPWDARQLPLESRSVKHVVTNLPWGRQVEVGEEIAAFYQRVCAEIDRVLTSNGQVVALTNLPHLLDFEKRRKVIQTEISLFGQMPTIMKFTVT